MTYWDCLCPCLLNNKYNVPALSKGIFCIFILHFYFGSSPANCMVGPAFESCKIPTNPEFTGICVVMGHFKYYMLGTAEHMVGITSQLMWMSHQTSFTKHRFEDKTNKFQGCNRRTLNPSWGPGSPHSSNSFKAGPVPCTYWLYILRYCSLFIILHEHI